MDIFSSLDNLFFLIKLSRELSFYGIEFLTFYDVFALTPLLSFAESLITLDAVFSRLFITISSVRLQTF